jgi:hypothetical protein
MSQIQYLSELDMIRASRKYRPIIEDMSKKQLQILTLFLINGMDIDYAFDLAMTYPREE